MGSVAKRWGQSSINFELVNKCAKREAVAKLKKQLNYLNILIFATEPILSYISYYQMLFISKTNLCRKQEKVPRGCREAPRHNCLKVWFIFYFLVGNGLSETCSASSRTGQVYSVPCCSGITSCYHQSSWKAIL